MAKRNPQISIQLGGILQKIRVEKKQDRHVVAEHINIGARHLSAIELGERNPSIETLQRLIHYYDVSADRIFYPDGYDGNEQLNEMERLLAVCTPKQRKLVAAFTKMLLNQTDLEL